MITSTTFWFLQHWNKVFISIKDYFDSEMPTTWHELERFERTGKGVLGKETWGTQCCDSWGDCMIGVVELEMSEVRVVSESETWNQVEILKMCPTPVNILL